MLARRILPALALLTLAVAGVLLVTEAPPPAAVQKSAQPGEASPRVATPLPSLELAPDGPRVEVSRTRWRLEYTFDATLGEGTLDGRITGLWSVEPLADERVAVRLTDARTEGFSGLPAAAELALGAELLPGADAGPIVGMGFAPGMGAMSRRLYTDIAVASWLPERDSDAWQIEEEDLLGRYSAAYRREGDTIIREAAELIERRGPTGLTAAGVASLSYTHHARFDFDDAGLARIAVDIRTAEVVAEQPMSAHVKIRLERLDTTPVVQQRGRFAIDAIRSHIEHVHRAKADRARVGDATTASLLEDVDVAIGQGRRARAVLLQQLAASLRLDPRGAAAVAAELRRASEDVERAGLLLGALGSAGTPASVDALASFVSDESVVDPIRRNAIDHIALSSTATDAAIEALEGALDGEHDAAAAAALGAQARQLEDDAPEAAEDLVEQLLARYYEATTDDERIFALAALGNAGTPRMLPIVRGLTAAANPALSNAAIYALRFVPDPQADSLLGQVLGYGGRPTISAIRTIAFRDRRVWRARLEGADLRGDAQALAEAQRVLAAWM